MSGRLHITYDDHEPHSKVEVAGEFTTWQPVPLGLDKGTTYAAIFDGAEQGESYQYKFIVDGQWTLLPTYPSTTDSSGFVNHVVVATSSSSAGYSQGNTSQGVSSTQTSSSDHTEEPYEFIGGQLDHPKEVVAGLGQVNTQQPTSQGSNFNISTYPGSGSLAQTTLAESPVENKYGTGNQNLYSTDNALRSAQIPSSGYESSQYSGLPTASGIQTSTYSSLGEAQTGQTFGGAHESYNLPQDYNKYTQGSSYESGSQKIADPMAQTSRQPYELTGSEIDRSVVMVPGLDQFQQQQQLSGQQSSSSKPFGETISEPYELRSSELEKPVEIVPGLAGVSQTKSESSELKHPEREPYEMVGSELDKPVEVVPGLNDFSKQDERKPVAEHTPSPYEMTGSELPKPVEKVAGLDQVQLPSQGSQSTYQTPQASQGSEIAKESGYGMPGSLPFENKLVDQTPYSAETTNKSGYADGADTSGHAGGYTGDYTGGYTDGGYRGYTDGHYADSGAQSRLGPDDSYDTQNFESASEDLDEPEFLAAALAGVSLNSGDKSSSGFPTSTSDKTLKQNLAAGDNVDIHKSEEYYALDRLAGSDPIIAKSETVIVDAGVPSVGESSDYVDFDDDREEFSSTTTPKQQPKLDVPYAQSQSQTRKPHIPIDVSTGFPMDEPSSPNSQSSSRQRSIKPKSASQLRNEARRPISYAGVPVPASALNQEPASAENRNAAVIAAATRASAFAKQDVAAISDPSQHHAQQDSLSRSQSDARPRTRPQSTGGLGSKRRSSELRKSSFSRDRSSVQLSRSDTKKEGRVRRFFRKIGGGQ